jgi:hypothetical protein
LRTSWPDVFGEGDGTEGNKNVHVGNNEQNGVLLLFNFNKKKGFLRKRQKIEGRVLK